MICDHGRIERAPRCANTPETAVGFDGRYANCVDGRRSVCRSQEGLQPAHRIDVDITNSSVNSCAFTH